MKLIHFSDRPVRLAGLRNVALDQMNGPKPIGLWLSDEDDYGWTRWLADSGYRHGYDGEPKYAYHVWLHPDANILQLRTVADLDTFGRQWRLDNMQIMWPEVAKRYDGIMITPYRWTRRLDLENIWYYGWDCASGCIWNPRAIKGIRRATKRFVIAYEDEAVAA